MTIDVCIVAGRRPDLLEQTLRDFNNNCFRNLDISGIFVNIDPIFGGQVEASQCVDITKAFHPNAKIFQPEFPGFCAAVKRLWLATSSEYIFHLEDDWKTLDTIDSFILTPFSDVGIAQVSFHTENQNWDIKKKGNIHRRRDKAKLLGVNIPLPSTRPLFSTSPSVLRGRFARSSASLMDEAYDPEKQFYSGVNKNLENYVKKYNKYIYSPRYSPVIEDIGRGWRDVRGIDKITMNANSVWVSK